MTESPMHPTQTKVSLETSTRIEPINPSYSKVGGWLLLLCVGMTIFAPMITFGQLFESYRQLYQYFYQFPGLETFVLVDAFLSICLMAFGVYAGIRLWSIKQGSVKLAQWYLLAYVAYSFALVLLLYTLGLSEKIIDAMSSDVFAGVIKSMIYSGVWYTYLNRSKRVMATFG